MRKIFVNGTRINGIGNLLFQDSWNSFGPFLDGSTFQDGTVRTSKGKFFGRFTRYCKGGITTIKIDVVKR